MQDPDREFNYYFAEEEVPEPLRDDVGVPELGSSLLEPSLFAFWHGIGTVSLPHTDEDENFMCVLQGWKDFTIVSPFERGLVYPGFTDAASGKFYPENYSPVNFDRPQYDEYPEFRKATVHTVRVQNGDCLFLPAFWWHRVSSSPDICIAVSHWFKPHHDLSTLVHEYIFDF